MEAMICVGHSHPNLLFQNSECELSQMSIFFTEGLFHLRVFVVTYMEIENWHRRRSMWDTGRLLRSQGGHTPPLLLDNQTSGLLMVQKSQGQPPGISKNPGDSWDFNYRSLNWWSPSKKQQIHKSQFSGEKPTDKTSAKTKHHRFFWRRRKGALLRSKVLIFPIIWLPSPSIWPHDVCWFAALWCFVLQKKKDQIHKPFHFTVSKGHLHLLGCHFNPGKSMCTLARPQRTPNQLHQPNLERKPGTWHSH